MIAPSQPLWSDETTQSRKAYGGWQSRERLAGGARPSNVTPATHTLFTMVPDFESGSHNIESSLER
jgi:hypothetical protein